MEIQPGKYRIIGEFNIKLDTTLLKVTQIVTDGTDISISLSQEPDGKAYKLLINCPEVDTERFIAVEFPSMPSISVPSACTPPFTIAPLNLPSHVDLKMIVFRISQPKTLDSARNLLKDF